MAQDIEHRSNGSACWEPLPISRGYLKTSARPVYGDHGFDAQEIWQPPTYVDPRHIPELKRDRDRLKAHLAASCPSDHAEKCLLGIAALCIHQVNLTGREATLKLKAMSSQLGRYPIDVVDRACRAYVQTGRWFPAWADLVPHLEAAKAEIELSLRRLIDVIHIGERSAEEKERSHKEDITDPSLRAKIDAIISRAAGKAA